MPNHVQPSSRHHAGIEFHSTLAFWAGSALTIAGVLLHLPDYAMASQMGYHMVGMAMSWWMYIGMAFIIVGMGLAAWGLVPRRTRLAMLAQHAGDGLHFRQMDDAHLTRAHWWLLFVLGVALVIDVMKPATLGFVMPGMREEYGLTTGQVSLLPFVALTGTVIGSVLWGVLADKMGRRATILLSSVIFIGTSICGFMPSFAWNLFMCLIMGMSAGGMLPIVYALMSESMPSKNRGWLVVLHGGMGTVGGYLVASGLAALLEPHFAWRILWFLGLPTGFLLLVLNRWIPESPRYLLERGRISEAKGVMARYGVILERDQPAAVSGTEPASAFEQTRAAVSAAAPAQQRAFGGVLRLFRQPYLPQTFTVLVYGLGWGLVNWGFLTFMPTFLADAGYERGAASRHLFFSTLLAVPGTVLVAFLYGKWSSRKSMILYALVTAAAMIGFAFLDPNDEVRLTALIMLLLMASGGVISMLSPYTAEVFPTHLRGSGSGLAAGSSKLGGILGPPLIAVLVTVSPGLTLPALVIAVPIAVSAAVLAWLGIETRDRSLEDIGVSETSSPATGVKSAGVQ